MRRFTTNTSSLVSLPEANGALGAVLGLRKVARNHSKSAFSAVLDLADLTPALDVFDLTKIVLLLGSHLPIANKAMEREKAGDIKYAQTYLLCTTTAAEHFGKLHKGATHRGILLEARGFLDKEDPKYERELRLDLLNALENIGESPVRLLQAMRTLSITEQTLMDDEMREILLATTEEAERQLRAAGIYEEAPEKEEKRAALAYPSRRPTSTLRSPSRLMLLEWGAYALTKGVEPGSTEQVYDEDLCDQLANELIAQSLLGVPEEEPALDTLKKMSVNAVTIGAIWGSSGFPQVVPTHKLAAALMATDPPPSAEGVRLPWSTFAVVIPNDLLPCADKTEAIDCVGISTYPDADLSDRERLSLKPMVWVGRKNNGFVTANAFRSLDEVFKCTESDEAATLLMRLLVGVILELDSPHQREVIRRSAPGQRSKGKKDAPKAWTFELKRDIDVDCRAWVGDYIRSGGTSPSVRSLTRGHQKRQPYGPRGALRKWIHVAPYWRGPLDGPVAVKTHKIGS
jgi:hypothetical protein